MEIMKKYVLHLDYLRRLEKIKTEKFVEGVCSDRQWRRYLNGSHIIPQTKLTLICNKLGITMSEFEVSFLKREESTNKNLIQFEKAINSFDTNKANVIKSSLDITSMDSNEKKFYEYCMILYEHIINKAADHYIIDKYSKLINFPFNKTKTMFTYLEVCCLNRIAKIERKFQKFDALEVLYDILLSDNKIYLSSNNRYYLPTIYHTVTKSLWFKGDIDNSLRMTQKGISYSLGISDNKTLAGLYYIESYILDTMNRKNEAYEAAKKCIATCISKGDYKMVNFYNKMFLSEQSYEIDIIRK